MLLVVGMLHLCLLLLGLLVLVLQVPLEYHHLCIGPQWIEEDMVCIGGESMCL